MYFKVCNAENCSLYSIVLLFLEERHQNEIGRLIYKTGTSCLAFTARSVKTLCVGINATDNCCNFSETDNRTSVPASHSD